VSWQTLISIIKGVMELRPEMVHELALSWAGWLAQTAILSFIFFLLHCLGCSCFILDSVLPMHIWRDKIKHERETVYYSIYLYEATDSNPCYSGGRRGVK
jgi:hypothetical protein